MNATIRPPILASPSGSCFDITSPPNPHSRYHRLQPNGMKVLAKLPGLLKYVDAYPVDELQLYSVVPEDKGFIGSTDHPRILREKDGLGVRSCSRGLLQRRLSEYAAEKGVPVHWGHKMESLVQDDKSVTVTFGNGVQETFSFVVGCDGLHSQTRNILFGEQPATYTGLSSVSFDISPRPRRTRLTCVSVGRHDPDTRDLPRQEDCSRHLRQRRAYDCHSYG